MTFPHSNASFAAEVQYFGRNCSLAGATHSLVFQANRPQACNPSRCEGLPAKGLIFDQTPGTDYSFFILILLSLGTAS